ncbi:24699_t:CDS:2, partial [Cetraspora pellucida]
MSKILRRSGTKLSKEDTYSEQVTIDVGDDNVPVSHNKKIITSIFCSPNGSYVVTWSEDDKSVFGYPVIKGQDELKFDYLISSSEIKHLPNCKLYGVSDNKHVILMTERQVPYNFGRFLKHLIDIQPCKIEIVPPAIIDKLEFFGPHKSERFLIKGHYAKSLKVTYKMANPYTLKVYSAINLLKHDGNEIEVFTVHPDHIIRVWNNRLFVQELMESEWPEYLKSVIDDNDQITTLFCGESVKKTLEDTLKIYKSDHDPGSTSKKKTFTGHSFIWNVIFHDRFETRKNFVLKAQKFDHEENSWDPVEKSVEFPSSHFLGDSTYFMECNLLESEDLLMITPIGVFIWTIKSDGEIGLLYYWGLYDGTRSKTPQEGIINNLESILKDDQLKFSNKKLLPSPHFNRIVKMRKRSTWFTEHDKGWGTMNAPNFQDLLDYYMNDVLLLELYGDDLMRALLQECDDEFVETFFKRCLILSEFQIEDGNISSSIKLVNIIFSSFPQLSEKSFTFVIRSLAHLAFIPSHNFKDSL